ncbi:adenylate/guanylate cyclase domain-containing protein [Magnetococcus sp. PR-3]|uniref:adenylate/guanylate cyclase domain-containing protein n=1 Tax=Magnetococcus sp. PR-3 TaxID=3120355 RepID=UPI002FCE3485
MIAKVRLYSGLVLIVFVICHFSNHLLGVVSLEWQQSSVAFLSKPWNQWPLLGLLLTAFIVHPLASLYALVQRKNLSLPLWQWAQTLFGLCLPFLLLPHLLQALALTHLHGVEVSYPLVQLSLWVAFPEKGWMQILLFIVLWLHGGIGLWSWLRLKPYFNAWRGSFFITLWCFPLLALAGHISSGQQVRRHMETRPEWANSVLSDAGFDVSMLSGFIEQIDAIQWLSALMVFLALLVPISAVALKRLRQLRGIRVRYNDHKVVSLHAGETLLDALRGARIKHPSLCGGRGRCSTCRVRIEAETPIPKADQSEQQVLTRIHAPPDVRLACQLRPDSELKLWSLLPADVGADKVLAKMDQDQGREQVVAVLFADLRGFTRFSEKRLPFDVVFVLNRYFDQMGRAIEGQGGYLDKFIGDGIMALFGLDGDCKKGCQQALSAAVAMGAALEQLNTNLVEELDEPLKMGIGIHVGPVIVGEMGYGSARKFTAIGDTVNTASRLEGLTKPHDVQLIISQDVVQEVGLCVAAFPHSSLAIRGRDEALDVRLIKNAALIKKKS